MADPIPLPSRHPEEEPDIAPAFSDEALALRFADRHADELRYVAVWNKWLVYAGHVWRPDETIAAFDHARTVCRQAAAECNKERTATALASAKTVAAVVTLARADRRLAATVEQWDADPWLLNTPGGVIDLQTGDMRPHEADDYFTRITAIAPAASINCPIFLRCMDRSMGGDQEMVDFLQRLFGYALTGSTREHALGFCYGLGANGKSLLLTTTAGIMGDYHKTAPIETFTASNIDRHPTDLAMLRGARLVTAAETEEGRRWAESRIKQLTGGDRVQARFMRQDFFEYLPQFKLVIAGNHKPGLRSVDEAIRRRFHLIPFNVTIPPAERDPDLADKLKAEWPGIFAWMLEGCRQWQRIGLAPPLAVREATAEYLEAEDAILAWAEECCDKAPGWTGSTSLFASWRAFAEKAGEPVGSQRKFSQRLEDKSEALGIRKERAQSGHAGFGGLLLKPTDQDMPSWRKAGRYGD